MTHPANMTPQERLALAERLRRDDCTAAEREAAARVLEYQEGRLALVRAALG